MNFKRFLDWLCRFCDECNRPILPPFRLCAMCAPVIKRQKAGRARMEAQIRQEMNERKSSARS